MTHRRTVWRAAAGTLLVLTSLAAQRAFREYPGREYTDFPLPRDYQDKAEWEVAHDAGANLGRR